MSEQIKKEKFNINLTSQFTSKESVDMNVKVMKQRGLIDVDTVDVSFKQGTAASDIKIDNYDIPEDYIQKILKDNPNFEYQGTESVKQVGGYWKYVDEPVNGHHFVEGNIEHSIEFNSYKIYDKDSGCTFYIQRFYSSEETIEEIIETVSSVAKQNPDLMDGQHIIISDFECVSSEYYQDYGREGDVPCTGGIDENGNKCICFYKEWIEQKNEYADWSFIVTHEAAHGYDLYNDNISNSQEWKDAMQKDNNYVSSYSKESYYNREGEQKYVEDFAESMAYLNTYGIEYFEHYFPNRTEVLKKIMPSIFE